MESIAGRERRRSACKRSIRSAKEKEACRGHLATRRSGAEPNTRRSELLRCCTCAMARGMRAVKNVFQLCVLPIF